MVEASKKNMKEYYGTYADGVYAASAFTYEEYSANPADYWDKPDNWIMLDRDGEPMALVVRAITIIDLDDKEMLRHHNYDVLIQEVETSDKK
jgi:hypothetical protein